MALYVTNNKLVIIDYSALTPAIAIALRGSVFVVSSGIWFIFIISYGIYSVIVIPSLYSSRPTFGWLRSFVLSVREYDLYL